YRSRSAARQVPLQRFRFPPGELGDALQAREARYGYDPGIHAGTRVLKEREPDVAVEVEHLGGILADAETHVTRTADAFHFGRSALEAREGVTEERLPVDAERTADGHRTFGLFRGAFQHEPVLTGFEFARFPVKPADADVFGTDEVHFVYGGLHVGRARRQEQQGNKSQDGTH